MKSVVEGCSNKIDQTEERICEVEDRTSESIQSEENKEKCVKRVKKAYEISPHLLEWSIKKTRDVLMWMWRKGNPLTLFVGM